MSKEELIKLLQFLDENDCLHSEFKYYQVNEDFEITYDVDWILEFINQNKDE